MPDIMELIQLLGGQDQPPVMGGPQPPPGMPYPLGAKGGNQTALAALAGIGMVNLLGEARKYEKAQNQVGMALPKPTQTSPFASGIGQADLQSRGAQVAGQQSPQGPPMGGGPAMPPGGGPGMGALMSMLAQRGMGGGM